MNRSTLKRLGDLLRQEMGLEDNKASADLRKLVEQLERREKELDRNRVKHGKPMKSPRGKG
jgi:hypothetical protein